MEPPGRILTVAQLGQAHGIRGFVRLRSWTSPPENVLAYSPWWCRAGDGPWQATAVAETVRRHDQLLVRFEGVTTRNAAEALRGQLIGVEESVLPPASEDEYYWKDLVGLAVTNLAGESLGEVIELMETGAHDVLVVEQNNTRRLIPFQAPVVVAVDLAAQCIRVEWSADWD